MTNQFYMSVCLVQEIQNLLTFLNVTNRSQVPSFETDNRAECHMYL